MGVGRTGEIVPRLQLEEKIGVGRSGGVVGGSVCVCGGEDGE